MTEELDALWARLVDKGKVRWMPGIVESRGGLVLVVEGRFCRCWYSQPPRGMLEGPSTLLDVRNLRPDWADPGNLGRLTAMARAAWGLPDLYIGYDDDGWFYRSYLGDVDSRERFEAEGEAALRAIDAAPGRS